MARLQRRWRVASIWNNTCLTISLVIAGQYSLPMSALWGVILLVGLGSVALISLAYLGYGGAAYLGMLAFAPVAGVAVVLASRHRRCIPPHCCQSCGYDLTGNVSGVCPECGAKK